MSKQNSVKVLDPPAVVKSLKDLPSAEVFKEMKQAGQYAITRATTAGQRTFSEAKGTGMQALTRAQKMGLRGGTAVETWWKGLPNDRVRAGIIAGAVVGIGAIPALVFIFRRRGAP